MLTKINNGFPLRLCSWSFNPIVPASLSGKMIRWLDVVCLKQVSFKAGSTIVGRNYEVDNDFDSRTGDVGNARTRR